MPEDFAKIVRASDGQQVLIYHEPDTESPDEDGIVAVIHYIAKMDFGNVDLKAYVTNDESVKRCMESFDQDTADRFIQRIEKLMPGASERESGVESVTILRRGPDGFEALATLIEESERQINEILKKGG